MAAALALPLFDTTCECGGPIFALGVCRPCYDRDRHDQKHFGGLRGEVLERDGGRCRVCSSTEWLNVHHRAGQNSADLLITLCAGCHARLHRLLSIRRYLPDLLLRLWEEAHPSRPLQMQLALEVQTNGVFDHRVLTISPGPVGLTTC